MCCTYKYVQIGNFDLLFNVTMFACCIQRRICEHNCKCRLWEYEYSSGSFAPSQLRCDHIRTKRRLTRGWLHQPKEFQSTRARGVGEQRVGRTYDNNLIGMVPIHSMKISLKRKK